MDGTGCIVGHGMEEELLRHDCGTASVGEDCGLGPYVWGEGAGEGEGADVAGQLAGASTCELIVTSCRIVEVLDGGF